MDFDSHLFADRSDRAKLAFTGDQRAWFLHQILTQSLEDIAPGEARDAAMITVHGRMIGYLEIVATPEALLAHFEPEMRTALPEEMARYVFATRVEIADVTDDHALVLLVGDGWEGPAARTGGVLHRTLSFGVNAGYLWLPPRDLDDALASLKGEGYEQASEDELEALRIERGMARWGRDMGARTLPPEVCLDDIAVHYDKGCYTGQEAMAKIRFRGKVNRRLRRLEITGTASAGAEVIHEGTKVGTVTSAAGTRALAILKHTVEPGTTVTAGDAEAVVVS